MSQSKMKRKINDLYIPESVNKIEIVTESTRCKCQNCTMSNVEITKMSNMSNAKCQKCQIC